MSAILWMRDGGCEINEFIEQSSSRLCFSSQHLCKPFPDILGYNRNLVHPSSNSSLSHKEEGMQPENSNRGCRRLALPPVAILFLATEFPGKLIIANPAAVLKYQ